MRTRLLSQIPLLVAVVLASATTGAVAAVSVTGADIVNGSITGKDIKNQSVKTKDLSPKVLGALAGPAGPTGPAGPQGSQGIQGEVGPQGPGAKTMTPLSVFASAPLTTLATLDGVTYSASCAPGNSQTQTSLQITSSATMQLFGTMVEKIGTDPTETYPLEGAGPTIPVATTVANGTPGTTYDYFTLVVSFPGGSHSVQVRSWSSSGGTGSCHVDGLVVPAS
jgi:hypothetical protein